MKRQSVCVRVVRLQLVDRLRCVHVFRQPVADGIAVDDVGCRDTRQVQYRHEWEMLAHLVTE